MTGKLTQTEESIWRAFIRGDTIVRISDTYGRTQQEIENVVRRKAQRIIVAKEEKKNAYP